MENQINVGDQSTQQIGQNNVNQPLTTPEKHKINYLAIGGVILACLLIFGFGGYYLGKQSSDKNLISESSLTPTLSPTSSQISDKTADWTSYDITTEPSLGYVDYTIKMPPSWKRIEHSSNFQDTETFQDAYSQFTYQLIIHQQKNYNEQTGKSYATLKELAGFSYDVPEMTAGGQKAARVLPSAESESIYKVLFFSKDAKLVFSIELETPRDSSKIKEGEKLFNQILSTFTFLNSLLPTQTASTSMIIIKYSPKANWQTYTDDVAKFSFQYNTSPTQPYNSHQSLGRFEAGKNVMINGCSTPPNGQEACLEQYTVTNYSNYNGGSRRDWMSKNINDYPNCQRYYTEVSAAGKNALLATSDCSSWGETYMLIPNGTQMIVFLTKGYSRDNTTGKIALQDWIREALSTFKFL
jgi:hypothetical protein